MFGNRQAQRTFQLQCYFNHVCPVFRLLLRNTPDASARGLCASEGQQLASPQAHRPWLRGWGQHCWWHTRRVFAKIPGLKWPVSWLWLFKAFTGGVGALKAHLLALGQRLAGVCPREV